jgi:hypothetical protein
MNLMDESHFGAFGPANFQVDHEFEQIGRKTMWLNARQLPRAKGELLILFALEATGDRF